MAKIFGGSASRLEVYTLFVAAVVLIGGGIGGAIVLTSSDSKPAEVAQESVETTVVDTTAAPTTAPPVPAPEASMPPPAAAPRPSPAPTVDYAQQYLDLSQPFKDKANQVADMAQSPNFYGAAKELSAVAQTYANGLIQASWPANAQQAIRDQAEVLFELSQCYANLEAVKQDYFTTVTTKYKAKTGIARALLGLPPS
jgi:hypothetical protein